MFLSQHYSFYYKKDILSWSLRATVHSNFQRHSQYQTDIGCHVQADDTEDRIYHSFKSKFLFIHFPLYHLARLVVTRLIHAMVCYLNCYI